MIFESLEIFKNFDTTMTLLLRTFITYFSVTLILRVTGRKSFTELGLFDFILAISIGDLVATIIIDKEIALLDGFLIILFLSSLDIFISFITKRNMFLNRVFNPQTVLLYYKGDFFENNMKSNHITKEDLNQAIRQNGIGTYSELEAIVLEPDGKFSIIEKVKDGSALENIDFKDERARN